MNAHTVGLIVRVVCVVIISCVEGPFGVYTAVMLTGLSEGRGARATGFAGEVLRVWYNVTRV